MPFLDEVAAQSRTKQNQCKMCTILDSMDKKERAEIEAVLADKSIPASPIYRALTARNYQIGETVVRKHRVSCVI